jgi:hypothetical protein
MTSTPALAVLIFPIATLMRNLLNACSILKHRLVIVCKYTPGSIAKPRLISQFA